MSLEMLGLYLDVPRLMLIFSRLAGLIMFQPVLGSMSIPYQVRAYFCFALTLLAAPFVELPAATPDTLGGLLIGMGLELLLGALIGLIGAMAFVGLQIGGALVAMEAGLAFSRMVDPNTGEQGNVISTFYMYFGTTMFVVVGGHRALLGACLDTFEAIPPLSASVPLDHGLHLLLETLVLGSEVAIKIAAPLVIAMFLINLAMGFISRTVPQLNIMTVGFSLKSLVGFLLAAISLPTVANVVMESFAIVIDGVRELLGP